MYSNSNNLWLAFFINTSELKKTNEHCGASSVHARVIGRLHCAWQLHGHSLFSNETRHVLVIYPSPMLPRLHNALLIFQYCMACPAAILMSHPVRPSDAQILLWRRRGKQFWTSAAAVSPGNNFQMHCWRDEEPIDCNGAMEESNLASLKI